MNSPKELDSERTQRLTTAILLALRENYTRGPTSRDRAFEALNALAVCTALLIAGCDGPQGEAEGFFQRAIKENLAAIRERYTSGQEPKEL